jgi:integrase
MDDDRPKKHNFQEDGPRKITVKLKSREKPVTRYEHEIRYPKSPKHKKGYRKRPRFTRKRDAVRWHAAELHKIETGEYLAELTGARTKLGAAIDRYRKYAQFRKKSYKTYIKSGLDWLEKGLGRKILLQDITKTHIETIQGDMVEEHELAYSTADKFVTVAKTFFYYCIKADLMLSPNPAVEVELYNVDNRRVRCLDEKKELPAFMAAVREGPWYLESMCLIDLHTGLRRSNLIGLHWGQVDFENRLLLIPGSQLKNKKMLNLPMDQIVYDELWKLKHLTGQYEFVFTHTKGKFKGQRITDVKNAFNGAVERAGMYVSKEDKKGKERKIRTFHFHDMRHTFASWLVMRGVSLGALQKLMGHQTLKMTERYAHFAPDYLKNEIRVLEEIKY